MNIFLKKLEIYLETFEFNKTFGRYKVHDKNYCYSISFGTLFVNGIERLNILDNNKKYSELYFLLRQLLLLSPYDFEFTTITINKNLKCIPHTDKNNYGHSLIIGIGNYVGGFLKINNFDVNLKKKWKYFNGSTQIHSVTPFIGNRYTIIFYNYKK